MSWVRRRFALVMTWVVVVAWVVFYAIAAANADSGPSLQGAVQQLVLPPLLWVLAVRFVLRRRRSEIGTSTMDPPERVLAATAAELPERRREWGQAITAELGEVRGRSARWRFAFSGVRAMLWLPLAGRWPALALVAGVGAAATTAAGLVVGVAVPGLRVFAVTFTGLVVVMVVLATARARRPRLPVPAATTVVALGVAAAITMTAILLHRDSAAAAYLPPAAAVYLAVVLAGCLWIALAAPRWLGTSRLALHLGAAGGLVFMAWFLLVIRMNVEPPLPLVFVLGLVIVLVPAAALFVPAFAAGRAGRSFRAGVQAAVWTVTAAMPLTFALWLHEGLRRHAIDGRSLDGEVLQPVGANLAEALIFCLGIFPMLGFPLAVIGAALGARHTTPDSPAEKHPQPTP